MLYVQSVMRFVFGQCSILDSGVRFRDAQLVMCSHLSLCRHFPLLKIDRVDFLGECLYLNEDIIILPSHVNIACRWIV